LQSNAAAKAVFDEVNAKGGIHGRKIVLESIDDGYDPAKAIENFKKLTAPENAVFGLFAIGGTPANIALQAQIEEARIPHVAPLSGIDLLRKPEQRMTFHIRASYGQELAKLAEYLATSGKRDVAVLHSDNSFGKGGLALFEAVSAPFAIKIVGKVVMPDKVESLGALTQALKDTGAKAVLGITSSQSALTWAKSEIPRLGMPYATISLLGNEGTIKAMGEAATGIIVSQTFPYPYSSKYPVSNAYSALMKKAGVTPLGFSGMEGYVAARIVVEALRRTGKNLTREGYIAALSGRKFDLNGYVVDFTGGKRVGSSFVELSLVQSNGRFAQ
jgi:branched-chain amino acid transport system substrate-binding protein